MLEPRHVAALLVDHDEEAAQLGGQRRYLLRARHVVREEHDAAEPALDPLPQPVGNDEPVEAGQQARRGPAVETQALTAPAVSPKAIFRCTSRKKTITGIAIREPDRRRLLRPVVQEDPGEDVLVPARDEGEDRGRHEPGRHQRQEDLHEGAEPARAVHHRRLLELARDPEQEPAQRPHRERQHEGHVREDHARQRVHLPVAAEHDEERDDQARLREHLDPDHQHDEELLAREAELRERDRGEERERHRERDGDAHDDQAVLDVVPEEGPVDRVAEVRERRVEREPGRVEAVDLVVRLERGRDHPEDREGQHDEDEDADEVPGRPRQTPPPAAARPPDRGRDRSGRHLRLRAHRTSSEAPLAAPTIRTCGLCPRVRLN